MWSGVGVAEMNVLTSVVRSMVENVSSPTLLMSDVMRLVRDNVVVGAFGAAAAVDRPLMPVMSSAVIARTENFLRDITLSSASAPWCWNIWNVSPRNIFETRYYRIWKIPKREIFDIQYIE